VGVSSSIIPIGETNVALSGIAANAPLLKITAIERHRVNVIAISNLN
jgi:hypothetical protein